MTKIIGHRGACGLAAENTLDSIERALACGVDEVEIDVRVTSDGVPVLNHDKQLRRSGKNFQIADHSLEALRKRFPELVTLDEAISTVNRRRPLVIEIKPHEPVGPVVTVVQQYLASGWEPHDFLIASFSQKSLRAAQVGLSQIDVVVIESWSGVRATWRARQLHTRRVAMNQRWLWSGFIKSMSRSGYHLVAYTLNDQHKAERWVRSGLYGIVTDYPDRFLSLERDSS